MLRNCDTAAGRRAPTRVGVSPRFLLPACATATLALAAACSPGSANQTTPPIDLGMVGNMDAGFNDGIITLYEVQTPVQLPLRQPSDSELSALGPAPANTPYPRAPWLTVGDESIEVRYTITNADSQDDDVWLLVDPWNEFVRWKPGVTVVDDEEAVPNYGYDLYFSVPANSRIEGTLTTDDMHEIAIKLASTMNMLASPQAAAAAMADASTQSNFDPTATANNIFNPQNRSNGGDPLYVPWIPPVIAGLTGFDLGLRTTQAANVAVEIVMTIQDLQGNRFVTAGSSAPELGPPPATLSPPGATF